MLYNVCLRVNRRRLLPFALCCADEFVKRKRFSCAPPLSENQPFQLKQTFLSRYSKLKPPFGFNGLGELVSLNRLSRIPHILTFLTGLCYYRYTWEPIPGIKEMLKSVGTKLSSEWLTEHTVCSRNIILLWESLGIQQKVSWKLKTCTIASSIWNFSHQVGKGHKKGLLSSSCPYMNSLIYA